MLLAHETTVKTKARQFDNFVVTGGTVICHNDKLRNHQWRQNSQIGYLLFSVNVNSNQCEQYGLVSECILFE